MSFLLDNKKFELNNMTDISSNINCIIEEMDLIKLTKTELLEKCEELGITKCKSKNKSELINLLQNKKVDKKKVELIITKDVKDINEPINTPTTQNYNLLDILKNLFTKYSLNELAKELNVASGTITRWIELNDIPKNYEFDILKLSNIQINYSNYSTKDKDQVQRCKNVQKK